MKIQNIKKQKENDKKYKEIKPENVIKMGKKKQEIKSEEERLGKNGEKKIYKSSCKIEKRKLKKKAEK